ncbi:MAG: molybdopterin-dependent oxidoreductase [Myxococcales bacterium]|nr:molybdopterin oxidoreductase family protein [Myxococcales bacterium]HIK85708.1 molybdopterin oxidoreductase family protein [Myxococcales bacterium]
MPPGTTSSEETRTVHRTCNLCEATCGVTLEIAGDQVVRVRGDKEDPFSQGFICPKGSTLGELHHDPDRLQTPLVRRDGELVPATWDEAFAEIETRLGGIFEEHGRSSLALILGNPIVHHLATSLYVRPLVLSAGTTNLYSASTLDQMPQHLVSGLLWGDPNAFPLPDLDRTDHLLMLGANPLASNGSLVTAPDFPGRLKAISARGGRVVVVDPRKSETAERVDEHLFIRPGTDAIWLAALVQTLFEEKLDSIGRLEPWLDGVETIRSLVAAFTPERVADICGIDAETTRRQARDLANAKAGAVYGRMGAHTVEFGTSAAWMTAILNVVTGNFDRPGGVMTSSPVASRVDDREPGGRGFRTGRWKSRLKGYPEINGEFPAAGLAEEIETPGEGQTRAVISVASNPVRSFPNSKRLDRAFADLDFYLAFDIYLNESTRHADVILPPPSGLCEEQYELTFLGNAVRSFAKYSPPVFKHEGLRDEDIMAKVALILRGKGADADPAIIHDEMVEEGVDRQLKDPASPIAGRDRAEILAELEGLSPIEKQLDLRLRTGWQGDLFGAKPGGLSLAELAKKPSGIDFGPMIERFPGRLKTKSGHLELAPAELVEDWKRVTDRLDEPMDGDQLLLIGRRHVRSNNSWMHNIPSLVKGRSRCTLLMNPADASKLGIEAGGNCEVSSAVGKLTVAVETTDSMMPGVVSLPHGWGHDVKGIRMAVAQAHAGVPSNVLTDDSVMDVASGNAVLNAIPVSVSSVS